MDMSHARYIIRYQGKGIIALDGMPVSKAINNLNAYATENGGKIKIKTIITLSRYTGEIPILQITVTEPLTKTKNQRRELINSRRYQEMQGTLPRSHSRRKKQQLT